MQLLNILQPEHYHFFYTVVGQIRPCAFGLGTRFVAQKFQRQIQTGAFAVVAVPEIRMTRPVFGRDQLQLWEKFSQKAASINEVTRS
jgi:hypothetical protein